MRRGLTGGLHSPQSGLSRDQGSAAAEISAADGGKAKRLKNGPVGIGRVPPLPWPLLYPPDQKTITIIVQRLLQKMPAISGKRGSKRWSAGPGAVGGWRSEERRSG